MLTDGRTIPEVPAVYADDGYLVLTLSARKGEVHYVSSRDGGGSHHKSFPEFSRTMRTLTPPVNPFRLALNMLARKRVGLLSFRARDERKILTLLQASKEELMKLDLSHLGAEYARLVGKAPPELPTKQKLVKELLMNVESQVAAQEKAEEKKAATPVAAGEKKPSAEKKPAAKKPAAPAKKAAEKKPAAKKPEAKKAPAKAAPKAAPKKAAAKPTAKSAPGSPKEGPFRAGSMKASAYDFFKKCGGDREKVVAHTVKLGATESTAKSWYSVFCKL